MDDFKVEIDVQSYLTVLDGRRVYTRGRTWDFMAGQNLSVAQIKAAVEQKFKWSTDQRMTIWYGSGDNTVPLICETEIAELFDNCSSTKLVRFGVTIESKQQHNEPAPIMAEKESDQPVHAPQHNEPAPVMAEKKDDQPVHAPFFFWPKQAYAGEYEDDEPVGCDGENIYFQKENVEKRRAVGEALLGCILPSVIKELNLKSKGLHYLEARASPNLAEISGNGWRHTVDLEKKECSCRRWQICGKPCTHALRFIFSKQAKLEEYVDECFSVARFKAAYKGVLMPIRGRSQWPKVNPGFDMIPPKLTRSAGRPRTRRIKNYTEGGTGRKHKCKRCGELGHLKKTCKERETDSEADSEADRDATPPPRKKSKGEATSSPKTPTKHGTPLGTPTSPLTRQRAAALAVASSPPSASTRSKTVAPSPLRRV